MNTHYRIHAVVRNRETSAIENVYFDVYFTDNWQAAWRRQYGYKYKLLEVLGVEQERPDEALA